MMQTFERPPTKPATRRRKTGELTQKKKIQRSSFTRRRHIATRRIPPARTPIVINALLVV
jgi:hypothetical protein